MVVDMASGRTEDLFPEARNPEGIYHINERCLLRTQEGHCVVIVSGMVLAHYATSDKMAEAYAMVNLVDQGWADQNDVARAFGCSVRTVRRHQRRFDEGGLAHLGRQRGYPKGRQRLQRSRTGLVQRLKGAGHSNREIARRVGVSEVAVRKLLRRLGWKEPRVPEPELALAPAEDANPKLSAFSTSASTSASEDVPGVQSSAPAFAGWDRDPTDRSGDRLLARLGLLEDAPPLFGSGTAIPHAGVLLAVPALIASGIFDCAQKVYGSLGPAFFGLRTTLLTLLLMALWRIRRPEGLKEHSPASLGFVHN
jgi:transposase